MYQKILNSDTPSTLAASINSKGSARIKLRIKKVQKIEELIALMAKLPGLGPRSAQDEQFSG